MLNKVRDKVDMSVLDELLGLCEDKMASPFKKKKASAMAIIQKEPDEDDGEEMMAEEDGKKDELSEDDLKSLLEEYMKMKG